MYKPTGTPRARLLSLSLSRLNVQKIGPGPETGFSGVNSRSRTNSQGKWKKEKLTPPVGKNPRCRVGGTLENSVYFYK